MLDPPSYSEATASQRVSLRSKTARLFNLVQPLNEDEVDRIPSSVRVGYYDLATYVVSMSTYVFDMGLDAFVAIEHYRHQRVGLFLVNLIVGVGVLRKI